MTQGIGISSGLGCAGVVVLAKGCTPNGLASAAIGFIAGGETLQGISGVAQTEGVTTAEKAKQIAQITLMGTATGVAVDVLISKICPTLSIGRALLVIGSGMIAQVMSQPPAFPHSVRCMFGTASRSAVYAGIVLTGAAGLRMIGLI